MGNQDVGFELYSSEHSNKSQKTNKSAWNALSESEKKEYNKKAARTEIESIWENARKHTRVTGWTLYMAKQSKEKNIAEKLFSERSVLISQGWKALSDAEKEKWQEQAKEFNKKNGIPMSKKEKKQVGEHSKPKKNTEGKKAGGEKKEGEKKKATGKRKEPEDGPKKKSAEKKKKASSDEEDD
eukprot:Phypoly_transcript_19256.p1 GENE.Phypoly_transcript_19256~~Phypoly_transcript_19256.p1  ORF type:complete len:195 (+),score=63.21 Phypoly_transcript_19256:37-585(+)